MSDQLNPAGSYTAYRGHLISPVDASSESFSQTDSFVDQRQGVLLCDKDGKIVYAGPWAAIDAPGCQFKFQQFKSQINSLVDFGNRLILPGFIDMHIHLPQVTQTARSGEHLLEWLEKYIFPAEAKFSDLEHAEKIASWFFDELLRNGTTTACVFTTIHKEATDRAFSVALDRGIRVIMGKVMMDENAPAALIEDTNTSLEQSFELYQRWHGRDRDRLLYAYTPRFAVTSSRELLSGVGKLCNESPGSYIHTHLSESKAEIEFVKEQFAEAKGYVDVYDRHGLLGCRSILAHSIHLSDSELSVIKNKDCALAHCPSSNFFLKSGVFPYARVKAEAIKFGLGSDVAAGPQMSMFQVMKDANYIQPLDWLDARELLYRSTLGAARALGLQEQTGSLQIGKDADFIVVDPGLRTGIAADILSQLTDEILSSMVFLGDDRIIVATYLRGKSLYKI